MRRAALIAAGTLAAALGSVGWLVRQPAPGPSADLPPAGADPAALERRVRELVAFSPRDSESLGGLDRCAAYLARELKAAGGRARVQVFSFKEPDRSNRLVERGPYRNVVAAFGPEAGPAVVIGAHYDAYGRFPGADDNASGAAALLELARLLGQSPPSRRVELAAYSLEEPPYFATGMMGSVQHARDLKARGESVEAMISLETIGFYSEAPGSQGFPSPLLKLYYPGTADFIAVAGRFSDRALARALKRSMRRASALPVYSISAPAWVPGIDYSDHASFWAEGFPAVMVSDTAFYRNPRYHTADDLPETLDYRRMAQVVDGVFAYLHGR